jgi:hypothetical protein
MIGVFPRPFCACGERASVIYGCELYCAACARRDLDVLPSLEFALLQLGDPPMSVEVSA